MWIIAMSIPSHSLPGELVCVWCGSVSGPTRALINNRNWGLSHLGVLRCSKGTSSQIGASDRADIPTGETDLLKWSVNQRWLTDVQRDGGPAEADQSNIMEMRTKENSHACSWTGSQSMLAGLGTVCESNVESIGINASSSSSLSSFVPWSIVSRL